MAGYVKIWTSIKSNPDFLSLSLVQRGAWYELLVAAKNQRDDGMVFYRNRMAMGMDWGCEGSTAGKILGILQEKSLIKYQIGGNNGNLKVKSGKVQGKIPDISCRHTPQNTDTVIAIKIVNYRYWQNLTVKELVEKSRKNPGKIPPLRPDQTKPDQTILSDKMSPIELSDLFNENCPTLPKVKVMRPEDKRWSVSKLRISEHPDKKFWKTIFKIVHTSDFLSGRNGTWTACNFDWIMKPTNLIKIYEGNYDNRTGMTLKEEQDHYRDKARSGREPLPAAVSEIVNKVFEKEAE